VSGQRVSGRILTRMTVVGLLVAAPLATAGCARAGADPATAAVGAASPTRWPASTEGGACYLLDYAVIEQVIGVSFDVAAASTAENTFTCVLQRATGSYPDLTLAVTPTAADAGVFASTVQPAGAAAVGDLGRIGYSASVPATADAGPAVEVGWLSGNDRLLILRYRGPAGPDDSAAMVGKLTALAKRIDREDL
jgi:hypothetical protein